MPVELSAAPLLTLTERLTAAARARMEPIALAQHLSEVLLSAIPALDGVALYVERDAAAERIAATGVLSDLAENLPLPLVASTPRTLFCSWEGSNGFAALGVCGSSDLAEQDRVLVELAAGMIGLALDRVALPSTPESTRIAEERKLLRTLIDNIPDYIFVKDRDSRMVINNTAHAVDVLGAASPDDVIGHTDFDFFPEHLARTYYEVEQRLMDSDTSVINEAYPSKSPDGRETWHLNTKVPLHDAAGEVTGLVGIVRDITELKQREFEQIELLAREQQQRLLAETLADMSLTLASQLTYADILDQILDYVRRLAPAAQGVGISLVRGNALRLERLRADDGLSDGTQWMGQEVPLQYLPTTMQILKSRKPAVREFLGPEDKAGLHQIGLSWLNSFAVLPVILRDRLTGIIWLGSQHENSFGQGDLELLVPLANAAAIALENARLLEGAENRANRQQQLNEISSKLQQSNDVTELLQIALQELGQNLGARVGRVRLNIPDEQPVSIPHNPGTGPLGTNGQENH